MAWGLVQTVAPAAEPVTLAEAKAQARVELTAEDTVIEGYIRAARDRVEGLTGRQLLTATWRLTLDGWPAGDWRPGLASEPVALVTSAGAVGAIFLPRPPLVSVTAVEYGDGGGGTVTLDASGYRVDPDFDPGRLRPAAGGAWPAGGPVRVTYTAGYGAAAAVPQAIREALLLLIGWMFEHREPTGPEWEAVEALLAPYRAGTY